VQITSALPIAKMVGSNRVVLGTGIVHVTGDAKLPPAAERNLRRKLVQQALDALQSDKKQETADTTSRAVTDRHRR
jgi:glycine reductase complex component B subunit gamma